MASILGTPSQPPRLSIQSFLVSVGGGLGAVVRYGIQSGWDRVFPSFFAAAFSLLLVNVLGCFTIGLLAAGKLKKSTHPYLYVLCVTGMLGGFTSFSAFISISYTWLDGSSLAYAMAYLIVTLGGCVAASLLGIRFASKPSMRQRRARENHAS